MGHTSTIGAETAPDVSSHALERKKLRGVLWVHPEESFLPFSAELTTLGRDAACDAVLDGPEVSRRHATIRALGTLSVLSDAGSRNGTFLNGERTREAPLAPGDVLRVGQWIGVVTALDADLVAAGTHFSTPDDGLVLGPRSREIWERALRIAASRNPVIIEGPTGTGKEVFARAIHRLSARPGGFVAVNCAALPETLVEAHLFGHAKGAFTGATQASEGLVAAAHRGTLLLDEIIDLPLSQQAKLLRVLEESAVLRLGETTPRPVDVRFIAACQEPLQRLVEAGKFRADLLGRLTGCTLRLLPLKERREEIPRLFLRAFEAAGGDVGLVKTSAIEALCLGSWPLNVRQLVHAARYAAESAKRGEPVTRRALAEALNDVAGGAEVEKAALSSTTPDSTTPAAASPESVLGRRRALWLQRREPRLAELLEALERSRGNVSLAAREVGLSRSAAVRLLEADAQRKGASGPR
jgi:DNA-binding NtrC family response regulator